MLKNRILEVRARTDEVISGCVVVQIEYQCGASSGYCFLGISTINHLNY